MIEDEPEGDQGGAHGVGSDEYTYTYYEFDGTDDDVDEERDTDEASVTPPTGETQQNHPAPPGNPTRDTRFPEAEIAALRQQLFAMEARAVQAERQRDEVIGEMSEMAQLLAKHFGI